jgi:hypothetical protein
MQVRSSLSLQLKNPFRPKKDVISIEEVHSLIVNRAVEKAPHLSSRSSPFYLASLPPTSLHWCQHAMHRTQQLR